MRFLLTIVYMLSLLCYLQEGVAGIVKDYVGDVQ